MKIDNTPHPIKPGLVSRGQGQGKVGQVAGNPQASPQSATHISQASANTSQDIDQARVSELRQAISNGQLSVNTDRISERLIDNVRDLLGAM